MVVDVTELGQRAREKYSSQGLRSLLVEGSRYATRGLWWEVLLRSRYLSTQDLKETAEGDIWYLEEEPSFRTAPPENPELKNFFENYPRKFSPTRAFACELRNCTLVGPHAVGLTERDGIIGETVPVSLERLRSMPSVYYGAPKRYLVPGTLGRVFRPEQEQRLDCAFPLSSPDPSYYHWIVEYLPKLRSMEKYTKETGRVPKIVVGSDPSGFVRDTLEFLGYGPNEYVETGRGTIFAERLVVSPHRTHRFNHQHPENSNYNLSKRDITWLRNRVRSKVDTDNETKNDERVYVSRQNTDRGRMMVNYGEVMNLLRKRGFESYVLEEMLFKEQVKLFMEAEVVIGPHGAGLVNMIFADDLTVVELHPRDTIRPHFYYLSDLLGFGYESMITESEDGNIVVDTQDLRRLLDSAGV